MQIKSANVSLARKTLIISGLFMLLAGSANAAERGERRGAPPEALSACQNFNAGDACTFSGRRGDSVSGQCITTPDEQLACAPEGHDTRNMNDKKPHRGGE